MITHDLQSDLKRLKLPGMADSLERRAREAEEAKLGYREFTALLVQDEVASRESNSFQKRLAAAGFSSRMTFESFDFEFNGSVLPAPALRDLASCAFIERRQNLVLAGPPGIGKSHIAQALGFEAARRGMDVVFFKTHKLLERLAPDRISARRSQILLKRCLGAALLILDDFAFRSYTQRETELLYAICDERLSEGSIIATSNRPPEDWYSVFPDPIVGGAVMDRLVSGALKLGFLKKCHPKRTQGFHDIPPCFFACHFRKPLRRGKKFARNGAIPEDAKNNPSPFCGGSSQGS